MVFEISFIISLLVSLACGTAIGLERQFHGSPAGLRTHMIVCLGGCLTAIVSIYVQQIAGLDGDVFRISAQVVSGIGFLGAGIIIFKHFSILGLTTAAGIWTTAIIGVMSGFGFHIGSFIAAGVVLLINTAVLFLERKFPSVTTLYVEIDELHYTNTLISILKSSKPHYYHYKLEGPRSGIAGHMGIILKIKNTKPEDFEFVKSLEHVIIVSED